MATTSQFIKRINGYKKCMRILNCANHIYLDEIDDFEFKKISKYNKSKNLYNKITHDFKLVNELIDKQDLLNAATILSFSLIPTKCIFQPLCSFNFPQ